MKAPRGLPLGVGTRPRIHSVVLSTSISEQVRRAVKAPKGDPNTRVIYPNMRTADSASGTHRGGGERSSGGEVLQPRSVDFEAESEAQNITLEVCQFDN